MKVIYRSAVDVLLKKRGWEKDIAILYEMANYLDRGGKSPSDWAESRKGHFSEMINGKRAFPVEWVIAFEKATRMAFADMIELSKSKPLESPIKMEKLDFRPVGIRYVAYQDTIELYERLMAEEDKYGDAVVFNQDEYSKSLLDYVLENDAENGAVEGIRQHIGGVLDQTDKFLRGGGIAHIEPELLLHPSGQRVEVRIAGDADHLSPELLPELLCEVQKLHGFFHIIQQDIGLLRRFRLAGKLGPFLLIEQEGRVAAYGGIRLAELLQKLLAVCLPDGVAAVSGQALPIGIPQLRGDLSGSEAGGVGKPLVGPGIREIQEEGRVESGAGIAPDLIAAGQIAVIFVPNPADLLIGSIGFFAQGDICGEEMLKGLDPGRQHLAHQESADPGFHRGMPQLEYRFHIVFAGEIGGAVIQGDTGCTHIVENLVQGIILQNSAIVICSVKG
jgi:hypothetical protein